MVSAAGYSRCRPTALRAEAPVANHHAGGSALAADLPAILRLHDELFPATYLGEPAFRRALDAADCAVFVARDADGVPVGYLYVEQHPADQEAYVHFLGVQSSQRGRGFAQALLGAAAQWGAERGFSHVGLTVREDRPGARRLYQRAGFVEVSTGRHWRKATGILLSRRRPEPRPPPSRPCRARPARTSAPEARRRSASRIPR